MSPQMGEFQSEAEAMKAHRRLAVEKKFAKTKQSIIKQREHRLADLKVGTVVFTMPHTATDYRVI